MDQMTLSAPVTKGDSGNSYGKYGIDNGVSFFLLGKAMGDEILQEAQLLIDFGNLVKDLNNGLTIASDKLKKIMDAKILYSKLTNLFNIILIGMSVGGVASLLVDPVENPTTYLQKFKTIFSKIGTKAEMISFITANIPIGVFEYFKGLYNARSTRQNAVTDLLKMNIDNIFTSFDGGTKTLNTLMKDIQESIKNEYKSSTLPLYYKNLQK